MHQRFRSLLITAQIALALVLVIGASLLAGSFRHLLNVDPGFNPERSLVAEISVSSTSYVEPRQITGFYDQVIDRVRSLPGVRAAGLTYDHPLEANWIDGFSIEGRPEPASGQSLSAWLRIVGEGYFKTAGTEVMQGREFTKQDDLFHPGAVVINQSFARSFFPNENPIGKRLEIGTPSGFWGDEIPSLFEIVGIVRDVRFLGLSEESAPAYYISNKQFPQQSMALMVRTENDPLSLVSSIRRAVFSVDPNEPIASIKTMENLMAGQLAQQRFNMTIMGLFGFIALVLAMIGVFGLISYQVTYRTNEFGIRMALGAQGADIVRLVLRQGIVLISAGLAVGVLGALALGRWLESILFGISAYDLTIFLTVSIALSAVALLACWIPARRAGKVDPMVALRYE